MNPGREDRHVFVVPLRPAIEDSTLGISAQFLADFTVDAEAAISHKDGSATFVALKDAKDGAFLPLVVVMHVAHEVFGVGASPRALPSLLLLRVSLKLGDVS